MTNKRILAAAAALALFLEAAWADIGFLSPDINPSGDVLFSLKADIPGAGAFTTLFRKRISDGTLEQLTFYPEALESLAGGSILQVRNRLGTGRIDTKTLTFAWVRETTPFVDGGTPLLGRLPDTAASPDGRWLVSVEPTGPASGRLSIYDITKSIKREISAKVERGSLPVAWSPDSSVLVYELGGVLYFARPEHFFSSASLPQEYRVIGPGKISSVAWYDVNRLLYVRGDSVYRVQASELLSRSLYGPLIGAGTLAGKIPVPFVPETDRFSSSPEGDAVIFAQRNRNVYYTTLAGDDYVEFGRPARYPYLLLPGNTARIVTVWSGSGIPSIFTESVEDGSRRTKAWRLSVSGGNSLFESVEIPADTRWVEMSPSRTHAALRTSNAVSIRDASTWAEKALFREEPVVRAVWADDSSLFIGGAETLRRWTFTTGSSVKYLYSEVSSPSWDQTSQVITASAPLSGKIAWQKGMQWSQAPDLKPRAPSGSNGTWRLYVDSSGGFFSNMIYLRAATGPGGTAPLIQEPPLRFDPLGKESDSGVDGSVVSHGSRSGAREVALVFDAMDGLEGLPELLNTLSTYGIRATFFINGEFIRQHPAAVNEIVKAGHQTASLFFTPWDLSSPKYRIDEDFVIRGLSRNEDDFYNATGQELSLLWHAPWYVTSPLILSAAEKAGYKTVSPDVSVLDWVTLEQGRHMPGLYKSVPDLIDSILSQKKPGSIIPVRIGHAEGGREDWLCDRIPVLVNALIESGYRIVTVDDLIARAR